jgi:SulP family sulfate permease
LSAINRYFKQLGIKPPQAEDAQRVSYNMRFQLKTTLGFFLRPLTIIRGYKRNYFQPDLISGLTVAVIMLPQAIAFALIAELPPQYGLYTAIVASIVGGLWGSSNQLQTGPTNTLSILTLSALLALAVPGTPEYLQAARLLAIMVGLFGLVLGIARLGVLVNFVSDSVIIGFTAGAGVLIILGQVRHLLNLPIPSHPELAETIRGIGAHLEETHWISLIIGLSTILVILVLSRISPKIPGALIAMVLASLAVWAFSLSDYSVKVVSDLPSSLPSIGELPRFDLSLFSRFSTKALAVTAIGLVESMSIARVISSQTRQRLDSNQEFVGQGLANFASGLFSGYPSAGSFTRSAVNFQAGARTGLASAFAGIMVLIALLTLAGWASYIPLASLSGVLILTALRLIDREEMLRIWRGPKGDRLIMVTTLVATLAIPLEFAVLIGVGMSLVYYLLQTSTPQVRAVVPDEDFEYLVSEGDRPACPQMGVIEIMGDLYFGAVHHIEEFIHQNRVNHPDQRYLLLRMHFVEHCDISGIRALEGIVQAYQEDGGDVFIARYQKSAMDAMRSTGFYKELGENHFLTRDENAIGYLFYNVLDPAICIYECPLRVFEECQNLPKHLDYLDETLFPGVPSADIQYMEPQELWHDLHSSEPPTLIDVREPREYKHGQIPQAQVIPLPKIIADTSQVPQDRRVVLLCRTGRRSTKVAGYLKGQGFDNVVALRGGMLAWERANLLEAIDE